MMLSTSSQCPKITILFGCQCGKFQPKKIVRVENFGAKVGYEFCFCGKLRLPVCYSDGGGIMAVTNVKVCVWSVKFAAKIKRESGKLSTIGCHLPFKLTNFGTPQSASSGDLSPQLPGVSVSGLAGGLLSQ